MAVRLPSSKPLVPSGPTWSGTHGVATWRCTLPLGTRNGSSAWWRLTRSAPCPTEGRQTWAGSNERTPPDQVARVAEIDERADAGQGTAEEFLERLAIVWPGYFSSPDKAPPMPALSVSLDCFAQTFASIAEHFERRALEDSLPTVRVPAVFLLGADSPIPPEHGMASAALIPGARCIVEEGCGHLVWLEHPGSVRRALETNRVASAYDVGRCRETVDIECLTRTPNRPGDGERQRPQLRLNDRSSRMTC